MTDRHDAIEFRKVLEEGKSKGKRRPLGLGVGIVEPDGDVGERPGDHFTLDYRSLAVDSDLADALGEREHIRKGVGRATDAPDLLANIVAIVVDTDDPDRRGGIESDGHLPTPDDRPFPEQGSVPAD